MPTHSTAAIPPGFLAAQPFPFRASGPGSLHLRIPLGHPLQKVVTWLRESDWAFGRHDELVSIQIPSGTLMNLLEPLAGLLTLAEQLEVRVVFQPTGEPPQLSDYFETGSLARFVARRQSGWLLDMMREDRLTSVFQPIVGASDGTVYGYECLLRGIEAGQLIGSPAILKVAGGSGLLFQLDQAARWLALREAAKHEVRSKIFINFAPSTFDNPAECLQTTVRLLDDLGIPRRQVVFELIESERMIDLARLDEILRHYRAMDFELALDDVGAGYASLNLLQGLRPDYTKLDAELIRNVDSDPYKAVLTAKLLEANRELGVKTIAEGVESAAEYEWLKAHGADFVQGFYFARPASPPPLVSFPPLGAAASPVTLN